MAEEIGPRPLLSRRKANRARDLALSGETPKGQGHSGRHLPVVASERVERPEAPVSRKGRFLFALEEPDPRNTKEGVARLLRAQSPERDAYLQHPKRVLIPVK